MNRIAELRTRLGLTQAALAQRSGMSREQINRIERGARTLTHREAVDLALSLGVAIEDLVPAEESIQFRGNVDNEAAQAAIRVFRTYIRNWEAIDTLRSLDERWGTVDV